MADDVDDAGDGTRWMSYDELAAARGISRASAIRLTFRKHWPRRTGNDGQARVAIPADAQAPLPDAPPDTIHDSIPVTIHGARDGATSDSREMEALARERQRADQAEARADRVEAGQAAAHARADRAEAREAELRAAADKEGRELTAVLLRTAIAETEARTLREALEEARRPAWRRWLGLP